MEAKEANNIPLEYILRKYGRTPAKRYPGYDMYFSPFRKEDSASFRVDKRSNRWSDFGSSEYGSAIDLVMKTERCSFLEAMAFLKRMAFAFEGACCQLEKTRDVVPQSRGLILLKTAPLTNKALLRYLSSRGIDADMAARYCKEAYYKIGQQGKDCFAVAFENNSGGMELRNPLFKGCAVKKDITVIDNDSRRCAVFEGFIDFLSYRQMMKGQAEEAINYAVLNSSVMLDRSIEFLKKQDAVDAFLDNDQAGRAALSKLKSVCPHVTNEAAAVYPDYKDLNAFWMEKRLGKKADKPASMTLDQPKV